MEDEEEFDEGNFSNEEDLDLNVDEEIESLLEDDEISPEEASFWHGIESYYEEQRAFKLIIKNESHLEQENEILLDEGAAIEEAIRKNIIVAFY